jgi:hypothetical protein
VQNSQENCAGFVNSMFAETAGSGVLLDALSTTTSALATVFTATAVTHSLSAASTIFGGVKTSISAEYLNTLAISHITQTILVNYSSDVQKYLSSLEKYNSSSENNNISVYAERSKIISFNNECSLAAAEGSIGADLQTGNNPSSEKSSPVLLAYSIQSKDLSQVTSDLIMKLNSTFGSAGLIAAPNPSASGVINLTMPKTLSLSVTSVSPADHKETANIDNSTSPPTLTIAKTPRVGDVINIAGTVSTQQATQTAPATAQAAGAGTPSGAMSAQTTAPAGLPVRPTTGESSPAVQ